MNENNKEDSKWKYRSLYNEALNSKKEICKKVGA